MPPTLKKYGSNTRIPYELIVIDNGSTDGTVEKLRAQFDGIRIRRNMENLGFAKVVKSRLDDGTRHDIASTQQRYGSYEELA